ncbi:MAG: hypothetical protein ACLQFI_19430 [Methylocella sp.]|jgi:hypothetical protein
MAVQGEINNRYVYEGLCTVAVEFRTNGPQGGDAGHGGFLEIKFENRASTCLEVAVDGQALHQANSLTIMFRGDAEMEAALECLEFLVTKLKAVKEISTS